MIEAFNLRTAHLHGDAMLQQARLRYDVFVKRRQLYHLSYDGLEYDQFDTPGAVYFVWRDSRRVVRGLVRLLPTTLPYMLQTCWPHLLADGRCPTSREVWEVTRVCVDPSLPGYIRRQVLPELFFGVQQFGLRNRLRSYVCVTRPHLIRHVLRDGLRQLGPASLVEGEMEAAFEVLQEEMMPSTYCRANAPPQPRFFMPEALTQSEAA